MGVIYGMVQQGALEVQDVRYKLSYFLLMKNLISGNWMDFGVNKRICVLSCIIQVNIEGEMLRWK